MDLAGKTASYSASKFALGGLVLALALQYARHGNDAAFREQLEAALEELHT
ncbi:MAG TPA: hypothetical protein VGI23_18780 [Steroidobacteraceae bacterium]